MNDNCTLFCLIPPWTVLQLWHYTEVKSYKTRLSLFQSTVLCCFLFHYIFNTCWLLHLSCFWFHHFFEPCWLLHSCFFIPSLIWTRFDYCICDVFYSITFFEHVTFFNTCWLLPLCFVLIPSLFWTVLIIAYMIFYSITLFNPCWLQWVVWKVPTKKQKGNLSVSLYKVVIYLECTPFL